MATPDRDPADDKQTPPRFYGNALPPESMERTDKGDLGEVGLPAPRAVAAVPFTNLRKR